MQAVSAGIAPALVGGPRHVAVIMDGNGRWARARGFPRTYGHQQGRKALRRLVEASLQRGIAELSVYAFSSENWARPAAEVAVLMRLLQAALGEEVDDLARQGVRLRFIGRRDRLPEGLMRAMRQAEAQTAQVTALGARLTLNVALDYGGRQELVAAARHMAEQVAAGALSPAQIDEDRLTAALMLADAPDLLIRTGGEHRLSNFLPWQLVYAELYFTDCLWPDFDAAELEAALHWYSSRERRYGRTSEQIKQQHA